MEIGKGKAGERGQNPNPKQPNQMAGKVGKGAKELQKFLPLLLELAIYRMWPYLQ